MRAKNTPINLILSTILILILSQSLHPAPAQSAADLKYMSVLRVETNFAEWDDSSWERAVPTKETDNFQWFEATIYDGKLEGTPSAVHLYKFDKEFDPYKKVEMTSEEWVNYRESYVIKKVSIPEGINDESRLLSNAFIQIFAAMVADTPSQHYGLRYAAHGAGDGSLFEAINPKDAQWMLENMTSLIGRRIDLLDMSHNCFESTALMHSNFYMYFDYIIASDWFMGGYIPDSDTFFDTDPDAFLQDVMTPDRPFLEGLKEMIDRVQVRWEKSKETMIANKVMQSLYLFDAHEYERMASLTYQQMLVHPLTMNYYNNDWWTFVQALGNPELENQFEALRIYYRDNKDFFTGEEEMDELGMNGIALHEPEWVAPDFRLFPPSAPTWVRKGESVDLDLIIRQKNAFNAPLTLESTHDEPTISPVLSEVFGEEPMRATLTIATGEETPGGFHIIKVTATGGDVNYTEEARIFVYTHSLFLPSVIK